MKHLSLYLAAVAATALTLAGCNTGSSQPAAEPQVTAGETSSTETDGDAASEDIAWPEKPVSIVVGAKPGGGLDLSARLYGKYLEQELGVQFPIVNVAGAGATLASTQVKDSAPDGYNILCANENFLAAQISGIADYGYEDFDAGGIALVSDSTCLVTNGTKFKTYEEMVEYAKENPGKVIASVDAGGTSIQQFYAIEEAAGIEFQIADGGAANDRITALVGGHIDLTIVPFGTVKDYVEAGKMNVMMFFNEGRTEKYQDYPNADEFGVDYVATKFFCMEFPKGTDPAIINKFSEALKRISENPEFIAEAEQNDMEVRYISPEECGEYFKTEYERQKEYVERYSGE